MCGRGSTRKFKNKKGEQIKDGFENWGGYMAAKRAKLLDQFHNDKIEKISDIFFGVKMLVNGLTHPSAAELKNLMAAHGGEYHMYQVSSTTHIIASNLPNVKIKHLGAVPIVKPAWIIESIALNKLLDYKRYLLYTNQTKTQPALNFPVIPKPSTSVSSREEDYEFREKIEDAIVKTDDIDKTEINKEYQQDTKRNLNRPELEDAPEEEKCEIDNTSTILKIKKINTSVASAPISSNTSTRITKTASDPKFLEEFYNNSRLHLISTLGAEFKQLVGQLREKSDGKFPGKEKVISERGQRAPNVMVPSSVIMHIDMDCFFASVGLRNHPELRGKPVAITHAKSGVINTIDPTRQASREKEFELYQERLPEGVTSRVVDIKDRIDGLASMSEIASCSYEARKYGIKNGMFLGQAVKLCPELKTLPYDFEGYKEVSNILYKTVASYTLDIEAVSCDEMYVDIRKVLLDTGLTVDEWATHIRNEIMAITGCPCSTGFGANRLQARLATRKAKPAGQFYLKSEDVECYMAEIPVSDLPGVGRATLAKLQNLGLNTCGDVQIASLKTLQCELGAKLGEKIRDQAFGRDNKPLDFNHERKSVSAEINYGIRFKTKEECYNFLQSLASEVFNRLSDINMKARGLTLKLLVRAEGAPVETAKFLGHGVCDAITKSSTSNITYNNADVIYKETKSIYDRLNVSFAELRGVGIQLTKLEKNAPVNKALSNFLKQGITKETKNISQPSKLTDNAIESNIDDNERVSDVINSKTSESEKLHQGKEPLNDDAESMKQVSKPEVRAEMKKLKELSITTSNIHSSIKKDNNTITNVQPKARGRPKGSNTTSKTLSSKIISRKNPTMDNFLGKNNRNSGGDTNTGNNEITVDNRELARLRDQIDINVLNELPEDIRKEIMEEYQINVKPKVSQNIQKTSGSSEVNSEKKSKEEGGATTPNQTLPTKHSPFSNLSWDQIKPVVKTWIQSESEPSEVDVEMLADHLRQLALDRKIEELHRGFNFLHRIFSDLSCVWHQAYFLLVNSVQQGMVARYGKVLLVENDFICCQIQ